MNDSTAVTSGPACDHRYVVLIYEDDYGRDWECRECGFEGHDTYV